MNMLASTTVLSLSQADALRRTRPHAAAAAVLVLCLASALSGCGPKKTTTAETAPASSTPVAAAEAEKPVIEPEAVSALKRMSAYLQTLDGFDLATNSSLDLVNDQGQRLTLGGTAGATTAVVTQTGPMDGTTYNVSSLAEHCLALLKEQMLADDPTGSAQSSTPRRRD